MFHLIKELGWSEKIANETLRELLNIVAFDEEEWGILGKYPDKIYETADLLLQGGADPERSIVHQKMRGCSATWLNEDLIKFIKNHQGSKTKRA